MESFLSVHTELAVLQHQMVQPGLQPSAQPDLRPSRLHRCSRHLPARGNGETFVVCNAPREWRTWRVHKYDGVSSKLLIGNVRWPSDSWFVVVVVGVGMGQGTSFPTVLWGGWGSMTF